MERRTEKNWVPVTEWRTVRVPLADCLLSNSSASVEPTARFEKTRVDSQKLYLCIFPPSFLILYLLHFIAAQVWTSEQHHHHLTSCQAALVWENLLTHKSCILFSFCIFWILYLLCTFYCSAIVEARAATPLDLLPSCDGLRKPVDSHKLRE